MEAKDASEPSEGPPPRKQGRPSTGKIAGGIYCCAVGCNNCSSRDRPRGVKFYSFPKDKKRCKDWIAEVNRVGSRGSLWTPSDAARLCSEHFYGGVKSNDPSSISYLPTLFSNGQSPVQKPADRARSERCQIREQKRDGLRNHNESAHVAEKDDLESHIDSAHVAEMEGIIESVHMDLATELSTEMFAPTKLVTLDQECQTPRWMEGPMDGKSQYEFEGFLARKTDTGFTFECHCITSNEKCSAISTIKPKTTTKSVETQAKQATKEASTNVQFKHLTILELRDTQFSGYTGISKQVFKYFLFRIGSNLEDSRPISREYKLTLVLVKLKLDVTFKVLASMFNIGTKNVKIWFDEAFWALHSATMDLVVWLNKSTIQARMPESFRELYPETRCIIDASEVECSRPPTPKARVQMYSSYKSRWTYKFLVSCAPSGELTFISKSFGGRCTDSELCVKSGFVKLVQEGDTVLADKGFPSIEARLNQNGGILVMPPFKAGQKNFQFTKKENEDCYKIAKVRVHIERAIERMKRFKCFDFVRAEMGEYFDASLRIVGAICNCSNDLIKE